MKRKRPKKPSEARCYDVEMIRDFLDHLLWELRISHYEMTTKTINPELSDQLEKYQRKRQTAGLLYGVLIGGEPDDASMAKWRAINGKFREHQIMLLEALGSLFKEALENAARPKTLNAVSFESVEDAINAFPAHKKDYEAGDPEGE